MIAAQLNRATGVPVSGHTFVSDLASFGRHVTSIQPVESVRDELTRDGAVFALARVKQDLLDNFKAFGLADKIGDEMIFPTLPTAVDAYCRWTECHPDAPDCLPAVTKASAVTIRMSGSIEI